MTTGLTGTERTGTERTGIELTREESAAVRRALRSYVADLRVEIVDTDNPAFKRGLREEKAMLKQALDKLDANLTAGGTGTPAGGTPEGGPATAPAAWVTGAEEEFVVRLWWGMRP